MQISLGRLFRPAPVRPIPAPRLGLRAGIVPADAQEHALCCLLTEQGPQPRETLVAALAAQIHRAARANPHTATLDVGFWGPALAHAEAEQLIQRSTGRLLVELR